MAEAARTPMIVTFKKKEKREDKKTDKQDLLRKHVRARIEFADVLEVPEAGGVPAGFDETASGLDVDVYDLPVLAGSFTAAEVKKLKADPNVEMVEEDLIAYATRAVAPEQELTLPTDELVAEDVPSAAGETLPWGVNRIDAERAWDVTRGAGIKVAVIDTGIDHLHPDLRPNFAGGVSFVPGESFTDGHGHGTHVAGTVGARENGSGVVGVAPNCSLYSAKALSRTGSGQYSWIISAIVWCVRARMDVINMSLGGGGHVQALQNACDFAHQHNLLLVAAAGNNGGTVGYPAQYDSVIAVSAVDSSGAIASFSSRGSEVDLAAPGVRVLSTWPSNQYRRLNGTSMAAPHVSGAAALAISSHRLTRAETIRKILEVTADNLGVPGRDDLFGHGIVDAEQAAFARSI